MKSRDLYEHVDTFLTPASPHRCCTILSFSSMNSFTKSSASTLRAFCSWNHSVYLPIPAPT